jgi:hypothetical protein
MMLTGAEEPLLRAALDRYPDPTGTGAFVDNPLVIFKR